MTLPKTKDSRGGDVASFTVKLNAFADTKVGDKVTRMLAGAIPLELKVSEVTEDKIVCGDWEFDRKTGCEIDDYLNWGPPPKMTGSFIVRGRPE